MSGERHFCVGHTPLVGSPEWAYERARYIYPDRDLGVEKILAKSEKFGIMYALDILRGPWPELEECIQKDAYYSYFYAGHVVKSRWPPGEAALMTDMYWACHYATQVLGSRWLEIEEKMARSNHSRLYYGLFPSVRDDWAANGWIDWLD